jgi:type IV secretion system protein VirB9
MRTAAAPILALFASFGIAQAQELPSHIRVTACSPTVRQEIKGIVGHPVVITFPPGENAWLVPQSGKPNKDGLVDGFMWEGYTPEQMAKLPVRNLVTIWADRAGTTTMTVIAVTSDGSLRAYPFLLKAIEDTPDALADPQVTLNLICKAAAWADPVAVGAGATMIVRPKWRPRMTPGERAKADELMRTQAFNQTGGCHYHAQGKNPNNITPRCPMDNGQWTLFRFPGLSKKPAIYVGSCEEDHDEERLARQHEAGDFVVAEEIAARFCLRLGPDVLDIVNDKYDPVGTKPDTGTIAPGVERDLIQAKAKP